MEPQAHDKDRRMLHALGYAQELSRKMSGFSNFAISFTIISILSGTLTLYYQGLNYGGFVEEAYGWPIVSFFVIIVGLGMAEIASKYPTAGGLYYWSSKMGGPGWGWFTGWFNLIGQIAITAGHHLRVGDLRRLAAATALAGDVRRDVARGHLRLRRDPRRAAASERLQRAHRRVPQRRLRVVARARRGHHRRLPDLQARPSPVVRHRLLEDDQQQRLLARNGCGTCCCSDSYRRSTRIRATTRRRT